MAKARKGETRLQITYKAGGGLVGVVLSAVVPRKVQRCVLDTETAIKLSEGLAAAAKKAAIPPTLKLRKAVIR